MNFPETQRALLSEVGRRLTAHGFKPRPVGQTFWRETKHGRHAVHLTFIDHTTDFDVTADVAVRFDDVEDIVHRANPLLSKAEKAKTCTLGAELGNIECGEPHRWTVNGLPGIHGVAEHIESKLVKVGFPYLDTYEDPDAALEVLARDDRASWLHSPIHAERAKRATALLIALGRKEQVEALGRSKMAFLDSMSDPARVAYKRFLESVAGK
jgi:hypothetical protein